MTCNRPGAQGATTTPERESCANPRALCSPLAQHHAVFREKETLATLDHPFICGLVCSFQTDHHLCFVLDFVDGGNMYSDLLDGPYQLPRAVFYAAQVCLALNYIHAHDILYRDLKPDNILLDLHGYLKLTDMGAARGISSDGFISAQNVASLSATKTTRVREGGGARTRRMTITGTHGYRAPEVYERDYGKAADWWNVGILIFEMLCRENPMRGENRRESEHLTKTKEVVIPDHLTLTTEDIVLRLLQKDPAMRLGCRSRGDDSFLDIKEHPFFQEPMIHWVTLLERRHLVPFDMSRTNVRSTPKAPQRMLTPQTNQIDYFSQTVGHNTCAQHPLPLALFARTAHSATTRYILTIIAQVDYMAMSIKLRQSWQLSPAEQASFDGFEHIAAGTIEEELDGPWHARDARVMTQLPTPRANVMDSKRSSG